MKKRILSLLLAVVMIMSFIPPMHVHAAECSMGGNHDWEYTNYQSMGCYRVCSKCRNSEFVDHDVDNWTVSTSYMGKQHTGTCKNCNGTISGSCSYPLVGGEYDSNETHHRRLCTVCGNAEDGSYTNEHKFNTTSNNNGTHSQKCSTCAYTKANEPCDYEYNSSYSDETDAGHTLICTKCGHESAIQPHTMGYVNHSDTQHYYCCSVCSYGKDSSSRKPCTYTYENKGATHTTTCKDCGNVVSGKSHSYSNGVCVCGAEKHDHEWKLTASGNTITLSCTGEGTCDVTDKGTLTINAAGGTYNGTAKKATVSRTGYMKNSGTVSSIKYYREGAYYAEPSAPKNAGSYTAEVTYSIGNKSATAEVNFTISKANAVITATGWEGNYDGNAHGITVTAPEELTVRYGTAANNCTNNKNFAYTNAGEYTVYYKVDDNSNYNIQNPTGSAVVKINKINKTVTASGYTGDYDGNAHGITVNAPEGLKVEYSTSGSEYSYSTSAPEFTDAGTYTVYYRVTGNKNYNIIDGTGSATVQIKAAEVTVTAEGYTGTYDGAEHGITVNAPAGVTVTYDVKEDGWYTYSNSPAYKNAGTYIVYYKATASKNYSINGGENIVTGSATVQINQANLADVVKVTPYSGTYDGEAHGITVEVPDDATVYYKTSEEGDWSQWPYPMPTFTDVGDYTVYYKVVSKSGNYFAGKARAAEVSVEGSSTVKITAFDLATVVNAQSTEFTYNRTYCTNIDYSTVNHSIKLSVGETPDSVTVEFSADGGTTWVSKDNNPKFTDAGVYPVKYRVYVKDQPFSDTESKNYVKAEGEETVTIKKAKLPFDKLYGYRGYYDGYYHHIFGHVAYTESGWGYTYWTNYWWLDDLTYEFEWRDDDDVPHTSTVTGKDNFLNYRKVPGFTKQNVKSLDSDEPGKVVKVKVSGKNYEEKTFTYNVKIGPGRAWAADREYVYDGKEHYIANYIAGYLYYWGYYEEYNPGSIRIHYRVNKADPTYNDDDTWLPYNQEPGQTNVGSKLVDWKVTMDSDQNGKFGEDTNTFGSPEVFTGTNRVTVTQAELTVTAKDCKITYGDDPANDGITISGFVASQNESVLDDAVAEFEYKDDLGNSYKAGDDVGTYKIVPTGLKDNNYSFEYVPGKLTVEPKSLPIEYDGAKTGDERFSVDDKSLVAGDECEIDTVKYFDEDGKEVTNPTEAGTYTAKFTLTGKDAKNYIPQDKDFTIQPTTPPAPSKPDLTVTAKNHTITYGSEPANNGVTITGMVGTDTVEDVSAGLNYAYSYSKGDDVGTYEIEPKGLTTEKYNVTYFSGKLTVTKKPVGIRLAEGSMVPSVFPADVLEGDTCDITGYEYYQGNTKLDAAPTAPGTYKIKVTGLSNDNYMPANEVEFTIAAPTPDEQAPTGNINVSTYNWNAFQNDVTFAIYFNEAQMVTITAADDKGVKSIEYFVSPTARSLTDVQSKTEGWAPYTASFAITPNQKVVVYAKITDTSDNVTYISSNGMIFDSAAPVVDGIDDGKKYSKDVEFTVTDNFKLDKVLVDGEKIEANDDGTYTIKYDGKKHTIVAIDEAGNKTELTITMRKTAAKDDDSPATGDEFNFVLWGFAMVASAAALLFVTMKKKSSDSKRRSRR